MNPWAFQWKIRCKYLILCQCKDLQLILFGVCVCVTLLLLCSLTFAYSCFNPEIGKPFQASLYAPTTTTNESRWTTNERKCFRLEIMCDLIRTKSFSVHKRYIRNYVKSFMQGSMRFRPSINVYIYNFYLRVCVCVCVYAKKQKDDTNIDKMNTLKIILTEGHLYCNLCHFFSCCVLCQHSLDRKWNYAEIFMCVCVCVCSYEAYKEGRKQKAFGILHKTKEFSPILLLFHGPGLSQYSHTDTHIHTKFEYISCIEESIQCRESLAVS